VARTRAPAERAAAAARLRHDADVRADAGQAAADREAAEFTRATAGRLPGLVARAMDHLRGELATLTSPAHPAERAEHRS